MEQLYVGTSNRILTEAESDEAVRLYKQLSTDWSPNLRHVHVAELLSYDTRTVSRWQVRSALERYVGTGEVTAVCNRHLKQKIRGLKPATRRKPRTAMVLETTCAVVQMVLQHCTLTAPQIRSDLYDNGHGLWSAGHVSRVRRDAGLTRKRTTVAKKEACPIAQHQHAESLIQLGYLPEHFIFIGTLQPRPPEG